MEITLYSTGCPKCKMLKRRLEEKNIQYAENNNVEEMSKKGIKSAPYIEVDGNLMDFAVAWKWATNYQA